MDDKKKMDVWNLSKKIREKNDTAVNRTAFTAA